MGDNVQLTVNRNGQIMDLIATLQARPPQTNNNPASSPEDQNQSPDLGPISELPRTPGLPQLPMLPPFLP